MASIVAPVSTEVLYTSTDLNEKSLLDLKTPLSDVVTVQQETPEDLWPLVENVGLARIGANPPGSVDTAVSLLQKNHERWHMYFRDVAGHNHIPHAILSTFAMGGGPQELTRAYDDGESIQRPMPPVSSQVVDEMGDSTKFRQRMQILDQYPNFLAFFEQQIRGRAGDWQAVVLEYCFAGTPLSDLMLAQLFEGLYHPFIHLGFGVEFGMSSLVAEGLAQTASHDPMYIDVFFQKAERLAQTGSLPRKALKSLYQDTRANDTIRTSPRLPDGPWKVRDGVLGRAMDEMVKVAAQYQVHPTEEDVERATAEMISCAAWACAAAHKPGKERKIDFFLMHAVTSSIFVTVLAGQTWLAIEAKARMVEWKARLDLVWYAASAAPELRDEYITSYQPTLSKGMGWQELYQALNQHHDDGHVAKFIRAIKNGEQVAGRFEKSEESELPINGDLWLRTAQLCYDSTITYIDGEKKWVWGAGFEPMWARIRDEVEL
ncbi:hypothetical protein H2200_009787 [Cladophialophora chaetospira]|uniref:Oxidoreductase AflY n=1 Tax=Cladophialophora chaetospira TaxID=386627 RepID=A0AA38X3B9_9EURO|nr:hypothetical protein H2200_009787 [Cladophialophora chaetospira]